MTSVAHNIHRAYGVVPTADLGVQKLGQVR